MANPKVKSTTQNFTEIADIQNDIVILRNGNACAVLEISSVNFYLLSAAEQEAKIYSFVSFLNSLSFSIQILIVSKHVDISSYLSLIEQKISSERRPKILEHLKLYKDFIQSLLKSRTLLDKKFYIVIPFSHLELGMLSETKKQLKGINIEFLTKVEATLSSKRANIISQLNRMGLSAKQLTSDELIKLFYELFNQEQLHMDIDSKGAKNIII